MDDKSNSITIAIEYDEDGNEIEDSFVVSLRGEAQEYSSLSEEYFTSVDDAYEFAKEVHEETGIEITWDCIKPAWVGNNPI